MVRVWDVSRCCSSNKQVVSIACNCVSQASGLMAMSSPPPSFFHPRRHSAGHIFSGVKLCDERALQDINGFIANSGDPVRG